MHLMKQQTHLSQGGRSVGKSDLLAYFFHTSELLNESFNASICSFIRHKLNPK